MHLRSLTVFVLVATLSIAVSPTGRAETYSVPIGNEEILFDPGDGYCPLDAEASDFDDYVLEVQREAQKGYNLVLAVFAPCDQLAAARVSQLANFQRWTLLLATLSRGELRKVRGHTRISYIDALAKSLVDVAEFDEETVNQRIRDAVANAGGESNGVGISNQHQLGTLRRDGSAIHSGILADISGQRDSGKTAGIIAYTLIRDYAVTYNVYRRFTGPESVQEALAEAQAVMHDVVLANESSQKAQMGERSDIPVATAGDSPDSADQTVTRAIVIGAVLLVVAAVSAVYYRHRGKSRTVP